MRMSKLDERLRNWPIRKKLIFSFGVIIATTFILIVGLIIGMKTIEDRLIQLYEGPTMNVSYSASLYYPQVDIQRAVNRTMAEGLARYDAIYPQLEETVKKNLAIMDEAIQALSNNLLTQKDKDSLEAIREKLDSEIAGHREETMALLKAKDYEAAREYNNTYYKPAVDEIKGVIEELEKAIMETAGNYEKSAENLALTLIIIGIVLLIVITYIAVFLSVKVTAVITEPIRQIEDAAKQLRVGDLSKADLITYESEDELGSLAITMRESISILNGYVKEICENFQKVASGDLTQDFNHITDFLGDFANIKQSFITILKEFNEI